MESRLEIEARASLAEPARGARATPDRSDLLIASARPAAKARRELLQFARAWPRPRPRSCPPLLPQNGRAGDIQTQDRRGAEEPWRSFGGNDEGERYYLGFGDP